MHRGLFSWILTIFGIIIFIVLTIIIVTCLYGLYIVGVRSYIILMWDILIYIIKRCVKAKSNTNPFDKFKTKNKKNAIMDAGEPLFDKDHYNHIPNTLYTTTLNIIKEHTPYLKHIPTIIGKDLVIILVASIIIGILSLLGSLLLLGINQTANFGSTLISLISFSSLLFSIFVALEIFMFILFRFSSKCLIDTTPDVFTLNKNSIKTFVTQLLQSYKLLC